MIYNNINNNMLLICNIYRTKIRQYCDIPGKCDICYDTDKGKRSTTDAKTLSCYRKIHHLHRGGMFMLDRDS